MIREAAQEGRLFREIYMSQLAKSRMIKKRQSREDIGKYMCVNVAQKSNLLSGA